MDGESVTCRIKVTCRTQQVAELGLTLVAEEVQVNCSPHDGASWLGGFHTVEGFHLQPARTVVFLWVAAGATVRKGEVRLRKSAESSAL